MAKLSSMNRNEAVRSSVEKYAAKRAALKAIANDTSRSHETSASMARLKLAEAPRNGNPTRIRNRCEADGPSACLLP